MKVIPMSDATSGEIVGLTCSPFSKTLVAVATSGGNVGLVDLDKEKG
jgi:protein NEDD1